MTPPFVLAQVDGEIYGSDIYEQRKNTKMGIIILNPTGTPSVHNQDNSSHNPYLAILENGLVGFRYINRWYDNENPYPADWAHFRPDWERANINHFYSQVAYHITQAKKHLETNPPKKHGFFW